MISKRHEFASAVTCVCGYSTINRGNWSSHSKRCKQREREQGDAEKQQLKERVSTLESQLATKDDQLAAKDKQIEELIKATKRPRTVTNNVQSNTNNYVEVNVFGRESLSHVTESQWDELLKGDHDYSVARLVTLKHKVPENQNVRIKNTRERWVELYVEENGEKKWQAVDKGDILGEIVETTAQQLDDKLDMGTRHGQRFERWHEQLKTSEDDYKDGKSGGKMFQRQMEYVHRSLADVTR